MSCVHFETVQTCAHVLVCTNVDARTCKVYIGLMRRRRSEFDALIAAHTDAYTKKHAKRLGAESAMHVLTPCVHM